MEFGTTCHVKAYHGNPRNLTYPLTKDDEEEFAETETEAPGLSNNGTSSNETDSNRKKREEDELSPKELRILQRQEELKVTHTGVSTCFPDPQVKWNECVEKDQANNEAAGTVIPNKNLVDCSYECLSEPTCDHWSWNAQNRACSLFTGDVTPLSLKHSYRGAKQCVGESIK